jgi:hypothetical protein
MSERITAGPQRELIFDFVPAPVKTKQPDDVVLSPVTEPMYRAFWDAFENASKRHGHRESTSAAYNAMMAVAPRDLAEMEAQWTGKVAVLSVGSSKRL